MGQHSASSSSWSFLCSTGCLATGLLESCAGAAAKPGVEWRDSRASAPLKLPGPVTAGRLPTERADSCGASVKGAVSKGPGDGTPGFETLRKPLPPEVTGLNDDPCQGLQPGFSGKPIKPCCRPWQLRLAGMSTAAVGCSRCVRGWRCTAADGACAARTNAPCHRLTQLQDSVTVALTPAPGRKRLRKASKLGEDTNRDVSRNCGHLLRGWTKERPGFSRRDFRH